MGANWLGRNSWNEVWRTAKRRKTALCSTVYGRNRVLFFGKGLAYRRTEETDLCSSSYGLNGVLLIGRGVAYRKTEETDLCWSAYGRNRGPVHREGCGVTQN